MQPEKMIPIDDIVALLNLEREPKTLHRTSSYNVRCPFCGDRKYHMNINSEKNLYRCTKCSFDEKNLNALDLYGRVRMNMRFIPGVCGNGRELAKAAREELYGMVSRSIAAVTTPTSRVPAHKDIQPADDSKLDAVYSALLKLEYLSLSDEHRDNLLRRGLDEKSIEKNGYASFYPSHTILDRNAKTYLAAQKYLSNNYHEIKDRYPKLKYRKDEDIIAGMLIANDLKAMGLDLNGIPGFYKLDKTWVMNIDTGLIIPTRNYKGEIVCLQIRKDRSVNGVRYITVSSSELKNGVNCSISRTHFPLGNSFSVDGTVPENGRVVITEGPLKADVAVHLYTDAPAMFVAVQGVNNTRELPQIAKQLKDNGILSVHNAFDMDKVCNALVWKAEQTVIEMLKQEGITGKPMFWDYKDYVGEYRKELIKFYDEHQLTWKDCDNDLKFVIKNTSYLFYQNSDLYFEFKELHPWKGEKGIDDYLLKCLH